MTEVEFRGRLHLDQEAENKRKFQRMMKSHRACLADKDRSEREDLENQQKLLSRDYTYTNDGKVLAVRVPEVGNLSSFTKVHYSTK